MNCNSQIFILTMIMLKHEKCIGTGLQDQIQWSEITLTRENIFPFAWVHWRRVFVLNHFQHLVHPSVRKCDSWWHVFWLLTLAFPVDLPSSCQILWTTEPFWWKCLHTFTFNLILLLADSEGCVNMSPNMENVFTQILERDIIKFVTLYFILKMVINSICLDNILSHEC